MHHATGQFPPLFDQFSTNLVAAGGVTHVIPSLDDIIDIVSGILRAGDDDPVWISQAADVAFPGLAGAFRESGIPHRLATNASEIRDARLGIAVARIAVAETGSVLLDEPDLADRSVSLMTQHLIVLCPEESLVPSLDEAAPVLREIAATGPSYATLVTGPSRTADIERELAVGVQGPGVLLVVFTGE